MIVGTWYLWTPFSDKWKADAKEATPFYVLRATAAKQRTMGLFPNILQVYILLTSSFTDSEVNILATTRQGVLRGQIHEFGLRQPKVLTFKVSNYSIFFYHGCYILRLFRVFRTRLLLWNPFVFFLQSLLIPGREYEMLSVLPLCALKFFPSRFQERQAHWIAPSIPQK